jgi:hypothetical protein
LIKGGFLIVARGLKILFYIVLAFGFSGQAFSKQKKAVPEKSPEQVQTETALAEIQAKFVEEQPGYIAELGVFDAEMQCALALYQISRVSDAKIHLSHADVIIYRRLLNRVLARRAVGFPGELTAFTKAIDSGESYKSLKTKYEKLHLAIVASRGKGDLIGTVPMLTAANLLMQKSAEYFNSGVANGQIVDAGQFQDAWGYMKAAKSILADIPKKERSKSSADFVLLDQSLAALGELWPNLNAAETSLDGPLVLSEAAAKLEEQLSLTSQP